MSTNTFKYRCKGQFATFAVNASFHWAAANEYRWNVHTQSAHHHPWCNFVTVRNTYHAVKPVSGNYRFQSISDDLAAWQGIAHTDVPHRNTIIYTDSIEFKWYAASFTNRILNDFTEFLQMHMTRYDINIGVTYCDKRFTEVLFLNTCGTEQTAVRCTVEAFFNHV
ncbi:hypothetical protein D3C73_1038480 [compost metagenome]